MVLGNVHTRKKKEDERASVLCSCVTCMPGALGIAGDHHARAAETTERINAGLGITHSREDNPSM